MKFRVTLKDPDALSDATWDAVAADVGKIGGLSSEERALVVEGRAEEARRAAGRWFEHGEYLTIEIDTEAGTATVLPRE